MSEKQTSLISNLFGAVEADDAATVQELIKKGCDVNARDKGGSTALMRASLHGYVKIVDLLLASGGNVNVQDKLGKTALHYAAQEQNEEVAGKLLTGGADVDSQDMHCNPPLSNAVFYSQGNGAVIMLLRRAGADANLPNNHGVTPIGLAKSIANFDILQYFTD
jgi:uncharacterized protein